jgi:hypothetical protein
MPASVESLIGYLTGLRRSAARRHDRGPEPPAGSIRYPGGVTMSRRPSASCREEPRLHSKGGRGNRVTRRRPVTINA